MEQKYVEQYGAEVERLQKLGRPLTQEERVLMDHCERMYKEYSK